MYVAVNFGWQEERVRDEDIKGQLLDDEERRERKGWDRVVWREWQNEKEGGREGRRELNWHGSRELSELGWEGTDILEVSKKEARKESRGRVKQKKGESKGIREEKKQRRERKREKREGYLQL